MADRNANDSANQGLDPDDQRLEPSKRQQDNEWLRDQTGEDHNLSGSSTFRNLPDQPEGDSNRSDSSDANERQSNR